LNAMTDEDGGGSGLNFEGVWVAETREGRVVDSGAAKVVVGLEFGIARRSRRDGRELSGGLPGPGYRALGVRRRAESMADLAASVIQGVEALPEGGFAVRGIGRGTGAVEG
jgi:hypothetical protein